MAPPKQKDEEEEEEEEDDYMNMVFEDTAPAQESSVQRAQRLKKESRARGVIKSKAQRAAEAVADRERGLATSLLDDPRAKKSKGLAMMAKMGFEGGSLGKKSEDGSSGGAARTEPLQIQIKENRGGIGLDEERKKRMREAAEEEERRVGGFKSVKLDPDEYRQRMMKEREDDKLEKQVHAAQRMAERLDDESPPPLPTASLLPEVEGGDDEAATREATRGDGNGDKTTLVPISQRPLRVIPVLYRGLIRHRAEVERDRRMRHDLEQSRTLSSRLPTYDDAEADEDDKRAMAAPDRLVYADIEELDEEDKQLERFEALEAAERLSQLLTYLRTNHQYCFWCKAAYPTTEMEGCPGISEEEHD